MKELSIEEKARRYDEVFKKAKNWYQDSQIDFKKSLENLFPELKESKNYNMNITDLMIGDLVSILCFDDTDLIIRITDIKDGIVYGNSADGHLSADIKNIRPILLTPKILEKNGFVYNDIPFAQYWEQFGLMLLPCGKGYRINCGSNISMIINSVNRLQHALKLCGIKQEIIL